MSITAPRLPPWFRRAVLPHERQAADAPPAPADVVVDDRRLRRWAEARGGAGCTIDRLAELLALQGRGLDHARAVAAGPPTAPGPEFEGGLPEWVVLLERAFAGGRSRVEPDAVTSEVPFADILAPFVAILRTELHAASPRSTAVADDLVRDLARTLAVWSCRVLYAELQRFRGTDRRTLDEAFDRAAGVPASRTTYQAFVTHMADGGLADVLRRHPVLGRALAQHTIGACRSGVELLVRLAEDAALLQRTFGGGTPLGEACGFDAAGDPHRAGRRVVILRFTGGMRLVYKPRPVGMERAFNLLLHDLATLGAPVDLEAVQVLDRGDYGWMAHVPNDACQDTAAVDRYYRRAGGLLCLAHLLDMTDGHHENVVAHGEHPVLVDLETVLHHRFDDGPDAAPGEGSADLQGLSLVHRSPARTGLLPNWQLNRDRRSAFDAGGLTGGGERTADDPTVHWHELGTDRMRFTMKNVHLPRQPNLPLLDGAPVGVTGREEQVVDGYVATYEFLLTHRAALTAAHGLLASFRPLETRIIVRPTAVYGTVLSLLALNPSRQADAFEAGMALELLGRAYTDVPAPHLQVLAAEQRAVARLDVPVFTAPVDGHALVADDGTRVEGYFARSSWETLRGRLDSMGPQDLASQVSFLRAALHFSRPVGRHSLLPGDAGVNRADPQRVHPAGVGLVVEDALTAVRRLVTELDERALHGDDGSLTWIAPQMVGDSSRLQLTVLGPSLYDGAAGVAVFLAAVRRLTGDERAGAMAAGVWRSVRAYLHPAAGAALPLLHSGLGGATGVGSVLYAGALVSRLLDDDGPLQDVLDLTWALDPAGVAADDTLDVIGGVAGLLLGLLAVHGRTGDDRSLELATACGDRLVAAQVAGPGGSAAWPTLGGCLLTGFSHGAAGIMHALHRLHELTGDPRLDAAIASGLAYERSLFNEATANWPDLRPEVVAGAGGRTIYPGAWCHGAPGIGLGRLGMRNRDGVTEEVDAAVGTTRTLLRSAGAGDHQLCCGDLGRADVLTEAARTLGRPQLLVEARTGVAAVLADARRSGGFRYSSSLPPGVHLPGLFTGASGVGYQLLRSLHPDQLPSVLLLETGA